MRSTSRRKFEPEATPDRPVASETVRVGRGAVHVVRSSDPGAPFGKTTVRFFSEGDRHQAAGWQDVVLPPDDEPEPSVKAGSFDRVPRQPGAIVALVLFGVALVAGVGYGVRAMFRTGWHVQSSAAAFSKVAEPAPTAPAPTPTVTPLPATPQVGAAEPAVPSGASVPAGAEAAPLVPAAEATAANEPAANAPAAPAAAVTSDGEAAIAAPQRGDSSDEQAEPKKRVKRSAARGGRGALPPVEETLDRQSAPGTTGQLAAPQPIDEPSIAPPPVVAPPPERAAPPPPSDPFDL